MHARDIPVVGGLIDTVMVYATTLLQVVRHPFGFVRGLAFDDPQALPRAFRFLGAAIALGYLIMTPALTRHGFEAGRLGFGVLVLLRLALITVLYHAAFFIAGYRQPIGKSLILSSYLNGVYFPIYMAATLPSFLVFGPQVFFDPFAEVSSPGETSLPEGILVLLGLALLVVAWPFLAVVAIYWWAKAFDTRLWLSAALFLAAFVLAGLGNMYLLSPVARLLL
jgi:hypothetical protein